MANVTYMNMDDSWTTYKITQTLMGILVICVYMIGIYLHTKVILVCKKEKEITWKLDIANSLMVLANYAHVIVMYGVVYIVHDLYILTGEWFCYTSKALTLYGNTQVTGHSFIIALMKYVMIVQYEKVRRIGKARVQTIFLWINCIYPLYMLVAFTIARPDFLWVYDRINQANICLGKADIYSNLDSNQTVTSLHNLCEMSEPIHKFSFEYAVYICRTAICWFHFVLFYLNFWNFLEMMLYCRIFTWWCQ